MDRSARKVLQNNRSVLCSVLDASMVAAAAVDVGLLNQEESEQVLRHGSPMANFLELLLERRPAATPSSPESSPIRGRNAADGSGAGRGDAFRLFLLVLESLEDYRTWAKFLEGQNRCIVKFEVWKVRVLLTQPNTSTLRKKQLAQVAKQYHLPRRFLLCCFCHICDGHATGSEVQSLSHT